MPDKNNQRPVLLAWIHSHVQSVPCNFSSVDVHTQHILSKIHDEILGLVVELKDNGELGHYDFFELSRQGARVVENCSRKKNCNTREQHQSCNNPRIYKSAIEKIMLHDDTLLEVRNFMGGAIEHQNNPSDTQLQSNERNNTPLPVYSDSNNDQSSKTKTKPLL